MKPLFMVSGCGVSFLCALGSVAFYTAEILARGGIPTFVRLGLAPELDNLKHKS